MTAARVLVADQIAADNPKITAYPWVYSPEQVAAGRPVVAVYRERMDRDGANVKHHLKLDVFVSRTDGAEAEAEAEDALDEVLLSLQRLGNCAWTEVQRVTFADAFTGYTITALMVSADPYKQAVLAERRPATTTEETTE